MRPARWRLEFGPRRPRLAFALADEIAAAFAKQCVVDRIAPFVVVDPMISDARRDAETMEEAGQFLGATCQVGAEDAPQSRVAIGVGPSCA